MAFYMSILSLLHVLHTEIDSAHKAGQGIKAEHLTVTT